MIKYTLILFNFLGVFVFNLFFNDGIEIQHATPESMAPGQTTLVEIIISKGDINGFAKLELIMPPGFSAQAVETKGASFTFSDQKAKFIWMALPSDESVNISYQLTSDASLDGNHIIKGTFSYIKDNQRLDHIMEGKLITMGLVGETLAEELEENEISEELTDTIDEVAETIEQEVDEVEQSVEDIEEEIEEGIAETLPEEIEEEIANAVEVSGDELAEVPESPSFQGDELTALRSIETVGSGEYRVKVMIVNSDIEGFGKISEYVPAGMVVSNIISGDAIPTVENYGVKFVWFEVPSESEFEVLYTLKPLSADYDISEIDGTFSYIYENAPQEMETIAGTYELDDIGDEILAEIEQEVEEVIEETTTESTEIENDVADNQSEMKTHSIPDPETGVTYKVQIVAGHNTVGKSYFKKRHNFTDNFNIENHEGWVKYTTGKFEEYKSARDGRESISANYNFNGPFVTAYSQGERITVQEALMITNQQWYQ